MTEPIDLNQLEMIFLLQHLLIFEMVILSSYTGSYVVVSKCKLKRQIALYKYLGVTIQLRSTLRFLFGCYKCF